MLTIPRTWWLMVTRRTQRLPEVLAVFAFAMATAVTIVVVSGVFAFRRSIPVEGGFFEPFFNTDPALSETLAGYENHMFLLGCAIFAASLLIPAAVTLGASATRLSLARRDKELATLRLVGATSAEVALVTLLDTVAQAFIGAILGVALSLLGLGIVTFIPFENIPLTMETLLLPVGMIVAIVALMSLIAALSALVSLLGVATSPLGVARQSRNVRMSIARVLIWVVLLIGAAVTMTRFLTGSVNAEDGLAIFTAVSFLIGFIATGVAAINLAGPFMMWAIGAIVKKVARKPASMVGASRLAADPKAGWRVVSGLGVGIVVSTLTTFIYSLTTDLARTAAENGSSGDTELGFMKDLLIGGYTTLVICAIITGVIAAVSHAAKTFDQMPQFRSMRVAGAEPRQINKGRLYEVAIPLAVVTVMATFSLVMILFPFFISTLSPAAIVSLTPTLITWVLGVAGSILFVGGSVLLAELTLSAPVMAFDRKARS